MECLLEDPPRTCESCQRLAKADRRFARIVQLVLTTEEETVPGNKVRTQWRNYKTLGNPCVAE